MHQNIPRQMVKVFDNILLHEELYPFISKKCVFYSGIAGILPCLLRFFSKASNLWFWKKYSSMHFIRFLYFKDLTSKIPLLFSILRNLFGLEPLAIKLCLYN